MSPARQPIPFDHWLTELVVDKLASPAATPAERERAKTLYVRALKGTSVFRATQLMLNVLQYDPRNLDALTYFVAHSFTSSDDRIHAAQRLVKYAWARLGRKPDQQLIGSFWNAKGARPYMRARYAHAVAQLEAGNTEKAEAEFEALRIMTPVDVLDVRLDLMTHYLNSFDFGSAQTLLRNYEEETSAIFCWYKVFERHTCAPLATAVAALARARQCNPFVEDFLIGRRKPSFHQPTHYEKGTMQEARFYAYTLCQVFEFEPDTHEWLKNSQEKPKPLLRIVK